MSIPATKITITGTIVDSQGNALSTGTVVFTLAGYGGNIPQIAGQVLIDQTTISATVSSGTFSASLYGNDVISPTNQTFYIVQIPTGSGMYVRNYQFTGSGTFDLSTLPPLGAIIPNAPTPSQVTPAITTAAPGQFFNGLTSTGAFTTGPTTLVLEQSNGVVGWSSSATSPLANADTGLSRTTAGTVAVGNGAQGDTSGTVKAATSLLGDGSAGAPSYSFSSETGTGFWRNSSSQMTLSLGGVAKLNFQGGLLNTLAGISTFIYGWTSFSDPNHVVDTGISRTTAGTVAVGNGTAGDLSGTLVLTQEIEQSANAAQWIHGQNSELLTLSTSGTTTDTAGNLLPANSIIEAVVVRVTTTITTATDWKLGDATQAARFGNANATMTAGTTQVGLNQADPTVASSNLGPVQVSAAKVRVTTTGTPGAGVIRITVFYRQFVPPTS